MYMYVYTYIYMYTCIHINDMCGVYESHQLCALVVYHPHCVVPSADRNFLKEW